MDSELTIRTIFETGLAGYLKTHLLPLFLYKAAEAIRLCRTAALGGHIKGCPLGHVERVWYNSCRHRACPQCAFIKIEQWLDNKRHELLPTDHFHFTFTLPSELYVLWQYNYEAMANLLFRAARDTLFKLLRDPKWMGGTPGILMALHTWARSLALNPHVHALVTGGGLAPDGTWVRSRRRDHLLSLDVVRLIFKAKFRDGMRRLIRRGELRLPPDMNQNDALWQLEKALRRKWIVDRRDRYPHGQGVATYLARYVRGGAIKNRRLVRFDGDSVTFRRSRRGEKLEEMTLRTVEFIRRILMHVPPPGFHVVRSYGLYSHNRGEERERCRELLGGKPLALHADELAAEVPEGEPPHGPPEEFCKVCGMELVVIEVIPRTTRPPPEKLYGRPA